VAGIGLWAGGFYTTIASTTTTRKRLRFYVVFYKFFMLAIYQKHKKSVRVANKLKGINRIKREQRLNKTKTH
jgi:hypothetical protein